MADLWIPDAGQLQAHRIGGENRGLPRVVWFTTEDYPDDTSALLVAQRFIRSGRTPHVVWHPGNGELLQILPADRKNLLYPRTRDASNAFLVAVVGRENTPFTDDGCMNLHHIVKFTEGLGVPRIWPLGPPHIDSRPSAGISTPGHYGASQVDTRLHGPGAIDINRIMESR